ncbi:MAG: hypothetical protein ACTHMD_10975 [Flavisolibacter sp.]
MKKLLLISLITTINNLSFSQSNWITIKIDGNLSIQFPGEPNKDQKTEKKLTMYAVKSGETNCTFSVLVKNAALSTYPEISKLSADKQRIKIDSFLSTGLNDLLRNDKIIEQPFDLRFGKYLGKQVTYQITDYVSGKITTHFARLIFIKNSLYLIQCSMNEGKNCELEKEKFLNSIKTN